MYNSLLGSILDLFYLSFYYLTLPVVSLNDFNSRQSYELSNGFPATLSLIFAYSQFILLAICFSLIFGGLLYKPYGHAYRNYAYPRNPTTFGADSSVEPFQASYLWYGCYTSLNP